MKCKDSCKCFFFLLSLSPTAFALSHSFSSVAQALLIHLFVELLQKCQVIQLESLKVLYKKLNIPNVATFYYGD